MKKDEYNYLVGKSRLEIKEELGDGFNIFKSDTWTYQVGSTWIGRKIILSIDFKEGKVAAIDVYKTFSRS